MKTAMITVAYYPNDCELVDLIIQNRQRFSVGLAESYVCSELHKDAKGMLPTWSRVPAIIDLLDAFDRVIWVDADAVLMNNIMESDLPEQLAFAHDGGGINDGITVTVKRDLYMWKVIWATRHWFPNQQHALHELNPLHTILPLDVWNNRWDSDWTDHFAKIAHFPFGPDKWNLVKRVIKRLEIRA